MCYYKHKSCPRGPVESKSMQEKRGCRVCELMSLCLAIQHLDVFHAFVSTFACVRQGVREDVRGSKGSQPCSSGAQLASGKVLCFKNLTCMRRDTQVTFKISLFLLQCKNLHQSFQDFLKWRHC